MKAKKLEGIYDCEIYHHYWQMSSPPTIIDDTSHADFHVGRKKDSLEIDNYMIPVESVYDGQIYTFGGYHYTGSLQFKGDSIYFEKTELIGLGGGNTYTFKGVKIAD